MDRVITIWSVVIAVLWIASGLLVVADVLVKEWRLGSLGIYLACAASVTTICRAVRSSHRAQRNAFELGRDAERSDVRRLRG